MAERKEQLAELLKKRIVILDGGMGTVLQGMKLGEAEYRGERFKDRGKYRRELVGDTEVLVLTRPDVIKGVHREYAEAGADVITTCTFGATCMGQYDYFYEGGGGDEGERDVEGVLSDVGMGELVREMNTEACRLAREAVEDVSARDGKVRYVAGSVGPLSVAASISPDVNDPGKRVVTFEQLRRVYRQQLEALTEGGVDVILCETVFDTLNVKACLFAWDELKEERGGDIAPVIVSFTIADKAGRTLSGQTPEAFRNSIWHVKPLAVGINCGMGADKMLPYVRELREVADCAIVVYPNAGMPDALKEGGYEHTAEQMAGMMRVYAEEGLVNMVGGCCGTTPEYIRAIKKAVEEVQSTKRAGEGEREGGGCSGGETRRGGDGQLRLSGLEACNHERGGRVLFVGERCNVAGSPRFARLIREGKYEEALGMARRQVEDGAQVLDICFDDGMLDGVKEMTHFLNSAAGEPEIARVPFMIDSSDWEVIEAGLRCVQGKGIVNSISLKVGEEEFIRRAKLIRRYGAAVVVMCMDERGQACGVKDRVEVASRAYDILVRRLGYDEGDVIIDPNVLTVGTGMAEHARYGVDFLEAVREIHRKYPGVHISGGISNVSFAYRGVKEVREVMHSVFLYHAQRVGLDVCIVNPGMLTVYDEIEREVLEPVEGVLLNRREDAVERLSEYARRVKETRDESVGEAEAEKKKRQGMGIKERLVQALVHGDTEYVKEDIEEAMREWGTALRVIEGPLMEGMKVVGQQFGEGKMFLPQVVKSARVMKRCTEELGPYMEEREAGEGSGGRCTAVLATVRGDVHDIGKNIVGVVLGCNGFRVVDLGVMVAEEKILEAVRREKAGLVALSGLITPSLEEMGKVAEAMERAGLRIPLMVGGATTSELHTAMKLAPRYPSGVVVRTADASAVGPEAVALTGGGGEAERVRVKAEQERLRREYEERVRKEAVAEAGVEGRVDVSGWEGVVPVVPRRLGAVTIGVRVEGVYEPEVRVDMQELTDAADWGMVLRVFGLGKAWDSVRREVRAGTEGVMRREAEGVLRDAREMAVRGAGRFRVQGCVGVFGAYSEGDVIAVEGMRGVLHTERRGRRGIAFADYLAPRGIGGGGDGGGGGGGGGYVGVFQGCVHGGEGDGGDEYEELLGRGVANALVEALADRMHREVDERMWPVGVGERSIRPAFGYPGLPDHEDKRAVIELLRGEERTGVRMTSTGMMVPVASVCGVVLHGREARYAGE